ncbi:MAG: NapC/NirT family cytochrome c [Desulfocapsa sp.]|nr:NapC/NirT family cytochrome c [Desulfocapsa sp.]
MEKHDLLKFAGKIASFTFVLIWAGNVSAADRPPVEECMRCHDVKQYQYELKNSVHAFDKDKKIINCEQCHVFHYSPLTSYYARDEYYDKKIFEPGTFDRRRMQENARQTDLTAKCQECHKDLTKDAKGEPISMIGGLAHDAFLGKNGTTRKTCQGCHINMGHLPDFDQDLMINAEFAKKLADNPQAVAEKGGKK